MTYPIAFLAIFSLLSSFALNIASAKSAPNLDLSAQHTIEHFSLRNNADLWIHSLNDYQIIEVLLQGQCSLKVDEIKKLAEPHGIFKAAASANTTVLINGGFFGYTKKGTHTPIGLVRSGGKRLNSLMPWSSGGFLVSSDKKIAILPASTKTIEISKWQEVIQSKPIVVADNKLDVRLNSRDSNFNRIAIATTKSGAIYILGVFQSFGEALTLYEYGKVMIELAKQRKIDINKALAMDGGPGAHIYVPQYDFSYGDSGATYVANVISVGDCK